MSDDGEPVRVKPTAQLYGLVNTGGLAIMIQVLRREGARPAT